MTKLNEGQMSAIGPKPTSPGHGEDVRFQGESGHDADWLSLPSLTRSGHKLSGKSLAAGSDPFEVTSDMCDDLLGTSLPDVDTLDMAGSERYSDIRQQTWSKTFTWVHLRYFAKASKQDASGAQGQPVPSLPTWEKYLS